MIIRTSTTGELMVILIAKIEEEVEELRLFKQLLQYVADTFPETPLSYTLLIINVMIPLPTWMYTLSRGKITSSKRWKDYASK